MMRLFIYIFFIVIFSFKVNAEIINGVEIEGYNRISNSNIILFGKIDLNEDYEVPTFFSYLQPWVGFRRIYHFLLGGGHQ